MWVGALDGDGGAGGGAVRLAVGALGEAGGAAGAGDGGDGLVGVAVCELEDCPLCWDSFDSPPMSTANAVMTIKAPTKAAPIIVRPASVLNHFSDIGCGLSFTVAYIHPFIRWRWRVHQHSTR